MPFIPWERREKLDKEPWKSEMPGEDCYLFYKDMVQRWKANPRWTTAHQIYRDVMTNKSKDINELTAQRLAWQVFFIWWVVPYEREVEKCNGQIK